MQLNLTIVIIIMIHPFFFPEIDQVMGCAWDKRILQDFPIYHEIEENPINSACWDLDLDGDVFGSNPMHVGPFHMTISSIASWIPFKVSSRWCNLG